MNQERGHRGHKDLQVCRQVFDALTYALAEFDDPAITDLVLVSVMPAPSLARVQVNLVPAHASVDREAALARLSEVAAGLRADVAAEITRRRVPELVFHIGYPAE
jgi:ribosome-binding factor A